MMEDHQIKSLMLLYELEKALSDMYVVCLHSYPEHDALWNRLISEEQMHAEAIRKLYGLTYQGKVLFDEGTIQHAAIHSIIDHINNMSEFARQMKYSEIQILSNSRDIEKSLIERKLFDYFQVSQEFADLLRTLQYGSLSHAAMIEKELTKITNKPKHQD